MRVLRLGLHRETPRALARLALLLVLGACTPAPAAPAVPPLPAHLAGFDPPLAERIRVAHAALTERPGDAEAWMALGMTYEANALAGLALPCYDAALALAPSAKIHSRRAQALRAEGAIEEAAAAMQRSIELEADYAPSLWRLGSYLYDLGHFEEARSAYARATELDADHSGGWIGLARLDVQEGRAEAAIEGLEALLERKPDDADALRLLRTAYVEAGRPAGQVKASWSRKTSMGKDPWHREFREYQERPLMQQALADLTSGRAEQAVASLEPFAAEHPDDMNAQSYLAWGYFLVGRKSEARATLDAALAKDPSSIPALRVLAQVHEMASDEEAAVQALARIVELDPNDMDGLEALGRLQRSLGRHAAAVATLERLLALNQRHRAAWTMKGQCELELERYEAAIASFRAGLDTRGKDEGLHVGLARALAALGRWEEAERALREAPRLSPQGKRVLQAIQDRRIPGGGGEG